MKHIKTHFEFNNNVNESYQEKIPYFDELKQIAIDIGRGKICYEKDTVWNKPHISKEQRNKFSKVKEWSWMKYEGVGPKINPSGEISPSGRCQSKKPYKSKNCELYSSHLYCNDTGAAADGEVNCPPMCYSCFNKWRDYSDFE